MQIVNPLAKVAAGFSLRTKRNLKVAATPVTECLRGVNKCARKKEISG